MEVLKFELLLGKYLSLKGSSSIEMEIIGDFLSSDVRSHGLKWLAPDSDLIGGNLTYIMKGKDAVAIANRLTDDRVTITKEQFFQLLTQWTEIYETKPKELLVRKVNDQFIFESTYD